MTDLFSQIYTHHAPAVFRYAFWLLGNRDDADDVTAEVFTRAFAGADGLRAETVRAYLITIARHLVMERSRRRRNETCLDETLPDPRPDPLQTAEACASLNRTLAALQHLDEIDRTALVLFCHEGLSQREISGVLGISETAVKLRIHRARLRLLELLEDNHETQP